MKLNTESYTDVIKVKNKPTRTLRLLEVAVISECIILQPGCAQVYENTENTFAVLWCVTFPRHGIYEVLSVRAEKVPE